MAPEMFCFIFREKPKNKKIIKFNTEKFVKCKEILNLRKIYKLKYNDLILPAELSDLKGYHADYYQNFTALAKKYRQPLSEDSPSTSADTSVTPQYFMMYVQFIDYYLILNLSIRTGDFYMFVYILPKIANLFFIFNQQNYTRYLTKYHDNLLKVDIKNNIKNFQVFHTAQIRYPLFNNGVKVTSSQQKS